MDGEVDVVARQESSPASSRQAVPERSVRCALSLEAAMTLQRPAISALPAHQTSLQENTLAADCVSSRTV
ncbi:hypothetical protein MHYP_G00290440 [Metynnis hypsauchen]